VPAGEDAGSGHAIHVAGVNKTYGEGELAVHALSDVDLQVGDGEFVVLLGPSGSGKTTLLNVIGGIERASSGSIMVGGKDVSALDEEGRTRFRRETVGFIFQFFNLIPTLTALENVQLIAELVGATERAGEMLDRVGLGERRDHFPAQLSGGEQQRVAVARALAPHPTIILADEPTANLDSKTGQEILQLMLELNRKTGATFIFSTHDQMVMDFAQRLVRLKDGQIESDEKRG
jgi:putative ABC transport system ATP-binding protein